MILTSSVGWTVTAGTTIYVITRDDDIMNGESPKVNVRIIRGTIWRQTTSITSVKSVSHEDASFRIITLNVSSLSKNANEGRTLDASRIKIITSIREESRNTRTSGASRFNNTSNDASWSPKAHVSRTSRITESISISGSSGCSTNVVMGPRSLRTISNRTRK